MPSEGDQAQETASTCSRAVRDGKDFPLVMNIVIQVIGSRGDIQPFLALGKELKAHGHRVRLATHFAFREFILEGGLEFFNIGGDPAELMAFMVKNPGLLPGLKTIRSGAIQKRRREMKEIIHGCWKSCYEMGDGTDLHQIKDDLWGDTTDYRRRPFVADAIIANPPSLAHIHCAQRLGVPLHIMFTCVMPIISRYSYFVRARLTFAECHGHPHSLFLILWLSSTSRTASRPSPTLFLMLSLI